MFPIQTTEATLRYDLKYTYYNHGYDLKDYGVKRFAYSDIDILELISLEKIPRKLKFHKVRDYVSQTIIQFYIYDVESNQLIVTLNALLDKQRMYFEVPDFGREFPNMDVRILVTQDPNKKPYRWTGEYW